MPPDQLALLPGAGSAVISECGRYRYELTRRWDDGPVLEFDMLNPSTAGADYDDNTIRRCVGFAQRWGYGALLVRNLYPLRATNPEALLGYRAPDWESALRKNLDYLNDDSADCTIAAFGTHAAVLEWFNAGHRIRRHRMFCLEVTKYGWPKHPLYVPSNRTPVPWEAPR